MLYALADLANHYWSDAPRLRPVELVREYEKTIIDELDLKREAANAAAAQAQLRELALVVCARGLLGLHAQQRDGDGARAGRADQ